MQRQRLFKCSLEDMKRLSKEIDWNQACFGAEREGLRVTDDGTLAMTPHPVAFGNKLTNLYITTDFSESQVEVVTPVCGSVKEVHDFLTTLCDIVRDELPAGERLWPQSMPCNIPSDDAIPVAEYTGDQEKAASATAYRQGLIAKYGGSVQMLCGIHFNFSLPEETMCSLFDTLSSGDYHDADGYRLFKDSVYLKMARGYLRYRWLVIYLTGCSTAYHQSFNAKGIGDGLPLEEKTVTIHQEAVSMRNSAAGYKNIAPLFPRYTSSADFCEDIRQYVSDGKLSAPKELYTQIRLKPVNRDDLLRSLQHDGIRYLELRTVDLNVNESCGMAEIDMHFLHHLMLWLLTAPEAASDDWLKEALKNEENVAIYGLSPALTLSRDGEAIDFKKWAMAVLQSMLTMEKALDLGGSTMVQTMMDRVNYPEKTYGAQLSAAVAAKGYLRFHLDLAEDQGRQSRQRKHLLAVYPELNPAEAQKLKKEITEGHGPD